MDHTSYQNGSGLNGPAHGSEWPSSPVPVGHSAEIWSCDGKKYTRVPWTFSFKLIRTSSFRPARTDKWKAAKVNGCRLKTFISDCVNPVTRCKCPSDVQSFLVIIHAVVSCGYQRWSSELWTWLPNMEQ